MKRQSIQASAPGKLMLFGEHAVVHGYPCIVTAVDQRVFVTVEIPEKLQTSPVVTIVAPEVLSEPYTIAVSELIEIQKLPKATQFILSVVKEFFAHVNLQSSLTITTKTEFSSRYGLGSSSAITVATIMALNALFEVNMSKKEMFEICFQSILAVQGVGSGFDVASAIWGGTIRYKNKGEVIESLNLESLNLVVAYTGIKAETAGLVRSVGQLFETFPTSTKHVFSAIEYVVELAVDSLKKNDIARIGELMNINHGLLASLGVSSKEIEVQRYNLLENGVFGAKLSGAGGGDCVIGSGISSDEMVKNAKTLGGEIIAVGLNAEGARLES